MNLLIISHAEGGGIERFIQARIAAFYAAQTQAWLLRPVGFGEAALLSRPGVDDQRFDSLPPLLDALRGRITAVEVHHLRSLPPSMKDLPHLLAVPYNLWMHDWSLLCPRGTFVTAQGRYCGEPAPDACVPCTAGYAMMPVAAPGGIAAHRAAAARLAAGAARIHVATADGARRLRRHLPGSAPAVAAWEAPPAPRPGPDAPWPRVCVAGRLTVHKGFEVLRACAEDAASRALPLDFVLAGRSLDDDALRATGRCAVLGEYAEGQGADWLRAQRGALGFLPSIWPETWCYALSVLHEAGLPLVGFDIGAQGERVRALGGTLLPPGLPPARINDILVAQLARPHRRA